MPNRIVPLLVLLLAVAACGADPAGGSTTTVPAGSSTSTSTTTTVTATSVPATAAGTMRVDERGVEQVWVPSGAFAMGSADASGLEIPDWAAPGFESEQPPHRVEITEGFWIDRYEVTVGSFAAFADAGGYATGEWWSEEGARWLSRQDPAALPADCPGATDDHPRACVTWYEAEAYAAWRGGRLPTEAEWEYAARGPDSTVFPWGDGWDPELANIVGSEGTEPVGSRPGGASWVGAEDMSGNVMEWVADWWSPTYYEDAGAADPAGPAEGTRKVEKGGWWGAVPFVGRSAYRHFEDGPYYGDHHIGFRIVTDAG
jgi:formylglycine-generating enzyme required for sulfatase activity